VPPGVYTVLSVEDTGTGIDEPTIARMFDPFFTTKGLGKGTGLGLSTTYGVVAGMNGAIRVQSTLGKGTTFRVYLPETSERIPVVAPAPPPRRLTPTGLRPIVLLVEDEPAVQRIVKLSLQREGYEVWVAGSGEEALEIARDRGDQLSVVVTDMMMPGMTGRAFADALGVRFPKMGVVFVSGYMEAVAEPGETLTDARHVFLQKPFTRAELAAAIRTVSPKPG
jgi:CheY-like chemotaxis protein